MNLHKKIEARKNSIYQKKLQVKHNLQEAKKRLISPAGISLTTVGGFVLGFLLLPKKFKLIKSALKAYTMVAAVKEVLSLVPPAKKTNANVRPLSRDKADK